jgi:chromosome segregation ATPase
MPGDEDNKIEVHERLASIETLLEALKQAIEDQREDDKDLDKKIDKILENDKDKLQRITKTEERVKNIKTTLWLFAAPIAAAVARWFM